MLLSIKISWNGKKENRLFSDKSFQSCSTLKVKLQQFCRKRYFIGFLCFQRHCWRFPTVTLLLNLHLQVYSVRTPIILTLEANTPPRFLTWIELPKGKLSTFPNLFRKPQSVKSRNTQRGKGDTKTKAETINGDGKKVVRKGWIGKRDFKSKKMKSPKHVLTKWEC